jgi:Zn-dependent peptidase ImmA (M78 family)
MTATDFLNSLVPRISKASFDDEATIFLTQYCPEALRKPMAVPIEQIATEKLGLTILEKRLSEDFSILGQMCFTDGLAEIYDRGEDEYREIMVRAGTMIIDPDTYYERNLGSKRNTVSHECVHWVKHRRYHLVACKLQGKTTVAFRCPTKVKDERFKENWTDEDWMEWQANGIAPRILMPRETVSIAYENLLTESKGNPFIAANLMKPTRWIIEQMAALYQVSKQSAEIRLKELGHLSA